MADTATFLQNGYNGDVIQDNVPTPQSTHGAKGADGCTPIGGGKEKYFDGAIKRILDNIHATDSETVAGGQCILSGNTELADGAAIEAALYAMWTKCPKQIRRKGGLSFVMSWDMWDLYDRYLTDKMVKYSENTEVNRYRFKDKRIIPIAGIPEHTIVLGNFTTGVDSNLWLGVDYANDTEVLKVDRLQSNSELFFFQMRMKMDVNIVKPAEIVVHTAYKKA